MRDERPHATRLLLKGDDNELSRLRTALLSFEIEQSDSCAPDSQQTQRDITAQAAQLSLDEMFVEINRPNERIRYDIRIPSARANRAPALKDRTRHSIC